MHDLLNENENKHLQLLLILNIGKEDQGNAIDNEDHNVVIDKDGEQTEEVNVLRKKLISNLEIEVYFHLLPQHYKQLEVFDIHSETSTDKDVNLLRNIIINYIKNFD